MARQLGITRHDGTFELAFLLDDESVGKLYGTNDLQIVSPRGATRIPYGVWVYRNEDGSIAVEGQQPANSKPMTANEKAEETTN